MSKEELALLMDMDYNCEEELSQCETLCPLVARVMNNLLLVKGHEAYIENFKSEK